MISRYPLIYLVLLSLGAGPLLAQAPPSITGDPAPTPAPGAPSGSTQDVVTQTNGAVLSGTLLSLDARGANLRVGTGSVNIPLSAIASIDFAMQPGEEELLASTDPARLPQARVLWARYERFLTVPISRAGDAALTLAQMLLASETQPGFTEALALTDNVIAKDWNHDRRQKARRVRLQALMKLDRAPEATAEARTMLEEADDEELLIEASWIIANSTFAELKQLQEENPRWYLDDRVKPERSRLYQEALDRFLYPSLFRFRNQEIAARGLWGAVELYAWCKEFPAAARRAQDLVALYPASTQAGNARKFLEEHGAALKAPETPVTEEEEQQKAESAEEAPAPSAAASTEEAAPAPAPEPVRELTDREKRRLKRQALDAEKAAATETKP